MKQKRDRETRARVSAATTTMTAQGSAGARDRRRVGAFAGAALFAAMTALAACGPGAGSADGGADGGSGGACRSDRECSARGLVCDRSTGQCAQCVSSGDCTAGQQCTRGVCATLVPCTTSRMCPNQVCDTARGFCADCVTEVDCQPSELCQDARCVPRPTPCMSDRECSAAGKVCDPGLGYCVECVRDTDCTDDTFCSAEQRCQRRVCMPGARSCANEVLTRECNGQGTGYVEARCADGERCASGACVVSPTPDVVTPPDEMAPPDVFVPPPDEMPPADVFVPPMDAGMDVFVPPPDVVMPPVDVVMPPVDVVVPPDVVTPPDVVMPPFDAGPPMDPCAPAAVINLDAVGVRSGGTLRYTGSTVMAPTASTVLASCQRNVGHVVALRYTPPTSARIAISTDNAGTTPMYDTVVWAQTACAQLAAGVMPLACDDDGGSGPSRNTTSVAVTSMAVTAGVPIFIFVGSYAVDNPGDAFELTIADVTQVPVGGACDTAGRANFCAAGSICSSLTATCVADGARGGRCRTTGAACDAALGCNNANVASMSARCVPIVPAGGECDTFGSSNVCTPGTGCEDVGGVDRCVAAGASGGPCRTSGAQCDAGLACSSASVCRTAIANGAACDAAENVNACTAPAVCAITGSNPGATCVVPGAQNGRCRTTGAACDAGLACNDIPGATNAFCRTALPAGSACDYLGRANTCVAGAVCVGSSSAATCVVDGSSGGRCRTTGAACDAGLACNGTVGSSQSRCRTAVGVGGACDALGAANACVAGSDCFIVGGARVCVANGASGGRCRVSGAACDAGLACNGAVAAQDSRCRTAVGAGGACDATGETSTCIAPQQCLANAAGTATTCQDSAYTVAPLTGPDATFVDACATGTRLALSGTSLDDVRTAAPVALPFALRFFNAPVTHAWPSSNGYLALGDGSVMPANGLGGADALPSTAEPALVAPYWQDLLLRAAPAGGLCASTVGTAPNRRVYLQWSNVEAYGTTSNTTFLDFEAVLNENNTVDFIYRRLEATAGADPTRLNGSRASIGLQGPMGRGYARATTPIAAPSAVRFTPR